MNGWAEWDVKRLAHDNPQLVARVTRWFVLAVVFVIWLWRVRHPAGNLGLLMKGLEQLISGRPEEAEGYFRKALAQSTPGERVRALVCLGDALADQGRYAESKTCLEEALKLGDPTGSGQCSMADLLLSMRSDPERAMAMAEEAMRLATQKAGPDMYFGGDVTNDLKRAVCWAQSAGALMLMNRRSEAQQAADRAVNLAAGAQAAASATRSASPTHALGRLLLGNRVSRARGLMMSGTYWKIGLALLAVGDSARAADHFRIAQSTDKRGKYRKLAERELDAMEKGIASPAVGWG
jgi:tetratricopeptide (TPR) repeat protein